MLDSLLAELEDMRSSAAGSAAAGAAGGVAERQLSGAAAGAAPERRLSVSGAGVAERRLSTAIERVSLRMSFSRNTYPDQAVSVLQEVLYGLPIQGVNAAASAAAAAEELELTDTDSDPDGPSSLRLSRASLALTSRSSTG